jgi:uncharacterized protein
MKYDATQDERLIALLAYVLGFFVPLLAPAVIFFVKRQESRFVAFHAMQSMAIDLVVLALIFPLIIVSIVLGMLGPLALLTFLLWPIYFFIMLAAFVLQVVAAIKAYGGELFPIPVVGAMIQQRTGL